MSASLIFRISAALAIALIIWLLGKVLLLLFAAILFACVLRGAAEWLAPRLRWPAGLTLAGLAAVLAIALAIAFTWIVPELIREGHDLAHRLLTAWHDVRVRFGLAPSGQGSSPGNMLRVAAGHLASPLESALGLSLNVLAGAVVLIVTALYLAASPELYVRGALLLFPRERRARVHQVMSAAAHTLRYWLLGQLVDMLTVGLLAAVGLRLLGVPTPFALGLLAGLLTFIPYFGAILGGIPAVLIALTLGWSTALWTLVIFTICHGIEGYIVAPLVQRRLLELPPALTIVSMTIAGKLFGLLGIALGTPLAAVGLVAIRAFYVEDVLGEPPEPDRSRETVIPARPPSARM